MSKKLLEAFLIGALLFAVPAATLTACGGSSGGEAGDHDDDDNDHDDDDNGNDNDDNGGNNGGGNRTCETKSAHQNYAGMNCTASGCHATQKTMSYAGTAKGVSVVTIKEDGGGTFNLAVNSQGNFCMRTGNGGNPAGGYTATTPGGIMVTHPTSGSCNTAGCHDGARPIF